MMLHNHAVLRKNSLKESIKKSIHVDRILINHVILILLECLCSEKFFVFLIIVFEEESIHLSLLLNFWLVISHYTLSKRGIYLSSYY